jgi:hypothetical protein
MHAVWVILSAVAAAAGPLAALPAAAQSTVRSELSLAPRTAEFFGGLNLGLTAPAGPPRWRFRDPFDVDSISSRWVYEMEDHSRVQIVSDPVRKGAGAVQFTLLPEDDHAGGNRSELKLYWDEGLGTVTWCSWSFLIPADYIDTPDAPGHQIIGQWHDRPPAGVAWADYTSHTPLIAVRYGANDGQSGIQINYGLDGINKQNVATQFIEKGRWIDLLFRVRWSQGADGYIEAWMDGQAVTAFNGVDHKVYGPNMYNETPPFLKIGLYRAQGFKTTNSIYFDEVYVGRRFADVAPH